MEATIKWGIIGLGKIAHSFASDLALIPEAELTAVASSDLERAKVFANQFNSKAYYDSYETLLQDPSIQIIYIATLHPDHQKWSIKAMEAGKAVLCEKPLAMNRQQVTEMIVASRKHKVFLMEAFWTRFNPAYIQAKQWIAEGKIGKLRYINATFSFYGLEKDKDSRILNLEKGGGALLDIGLYPVFLAYSLLGIPDKIQSSAIQMDSGLDLQISMIFNYSEAQAVLYSGITNDEDMTARICGTAGSLYLGSRWHEAASIKYVCQETEEVLPFQLLGQGYSYEILEAHQCLRKDMYESELWSHQNSLEMVTLLDTIREQCGIHYPADKVN